MLLLPPHLLLQFVDVVGHPTQTHLLQLQCQPIPWLHLQPNYPTTIPLAVGQRRREGCIYRVDAFTPWLPTLSMESEPARC